MLLVEPCCPAQVIDVTSIVFSVVCSILLEHINDDDIIAVLIVMERFVL